jgi:hypothetical protein
MHGRITIPALPALGLFLGLALALLLAPGPSGADTYIYYYKDENGVLHFTNKPTSPRFRLFAIFRHHPEVGDAEIARLARKYGGIHGVDADLVRAVIQVESSGRHDAVSHAGAEGLMQIMPGTQKDLGLSAPFDPELNVEAGVRYLRSMLNRFGSTELALAAYNAGPERVERYRGIPPYQETREYVSRVLSLYNDMKGR